MHTLHEQATAAFQARGLLSYKDLAALLGVKSVRSIQRYRKRFKLEAVDYWGCNPLFSPDAVAEFSRRLMESKEAQLKARSKRRTLMNLGAVKKRATKQRARK